jgi:hypothetical protein
MISVYKGKRIQTTLTIPRYLCESCGRTHALLPDVLIPFGSYSLRFVLTILRAYKNRTGTVAELCMDWEIAISTLYGWIHLFIDHHNAWCRILDRILYLFKEKKQPLILAIDEAQYLGNAVLKDLKMLMNFSYDSMNCFTLILSGEPYLNNTLEKSIHEALRQRITVHYAFQGLNPDEIVAYIHHKLRLAGGADTLIGEDALSALSGYCHGNPRIIDNVMSDALILGAQLGRTSIDAEVILAAVNEQALT